MNAPSGLRTLIVVAIVVAIVLVIVGVAVVAGAR